MNEAEPTPCTTEADCAEGKTCEAGVCMAVDTSNTGIAQESAGIDFANLFVGESYNLLAPKPAAAGADCAGTRLRHPMSGDSLMRRQKT